MRAEHADASRFGALPRRRTAALLVCAAATLAPAAVLFGTGIAGIDFGNHWDEFLYPQDAARSVEARTLLPFHYLYPSFIYWLTYAAAAPDAARALASGKTSSRELVEAVRPQLDSERFKLRLRTICLAVSSLAVVWVVLAVIAWRRNWVEGLLAGCFLAFSWEVAYHVRWIAVDGLVMQFSALVLLLCVLAETRSKRRAFWLRLAAVAAGLAAGTKYPAALLLAPVLATRWRGGRSGDHGEPFWRGAARLCLLGFAAYLVVTPGTILQPTYFLGDFLAQFRTYRSGHVGHTIGPGLPHLWRMLEYLATVALSHYRVVAAVSAVFMAAGGIAYAAERARPTAVLVTPLVFVVFLASFHVMIVRNTLLLFPCLTVLAARGAVEILRRLPGAWLRVATSAGIAAMLLVNAWWLVAAASTIRDRGSDRSIVELAAYLAAHPSTEFFLSERVRGELARRLGSLPANVVGEPDRGDRLVFYHFEDTPIRTYLMWPANLDSQFTTWFGPHEVNLDYYPNWRGDDHIVVMTRASAARAGITELR
ncbi:MAG TPA: phospholipid carrier-dependent glycosyltransferase [Thermoanaerobaculaceae bacterium]|nr:phospholipid carrier-dependent glycosyltransferase [Thermoanaerobaculaceae bacterium]